MSDLATDAQAEQGHFFPFSFSFFEKILLTHAVKLNSKTMKIGEGKLKSENKEGHGMMKGDKTRWDERR